MNRLSPAEVSRRRKRGLAIAKGAEADNLPKMRLAVLSTFNVDLLPPFSLEALERIGFCGDIYLGPFGQMVQEVVKADSGLYRAEPDVVVLIPAVEDLLASLFARPSRISPQDADALVRQAADQLADLVQLVLQRLPGALCLVVAFGSARAPMESVLDPEAPERGQAPVAALTDAMRRLGTLGARVVVVDWDWHTRLLGAAESCDDRLWYIGRMRLGPAGLARLADLVARHIAAFRGFSRKVAAVDLDNTLWGGVVGEAGLAGLTLGEDGLGLAFQDFQRELLKLRDVGVILAVCSKNNPDDAWEVFDRHGAMVLRREHIAASRINWQDKATNLKELAAELNVGLDSFVFFDDNPVEREWIRQSLPEVLVVDLPSDPVDRLPLVRQATFFQRIGVTDVDRRRAKTYREQRLRTELKSSTSFLDFLASLEQEVTIAPVDAGSLARAAQLCQRTNQFNLTTRRHSVADIEAMIADPAVEVYTLAVTDRIGDSGITGLGILRLDRDTAEIDTLLLSCRVLGRKIEDVLLAVLAEQATRRGARRLLGRYIPTVKNVQVARFYPDHGFDTVEEGLFQLDLRDCPLQRPPQIAVHVVETNDE